MERVLDLNNRLVCCVDYRTGYIEYYDHHTLVAISLPVNGKVIIYKNRCYTSLQRKSPETIYVDRRYTLSEVCRPE